MKKKAKYFIFSKNLDYIYSDSDKKFVKKEDINYGWSTHSKPYRNWKQLCRELNKIIDQDFSLNNFGVLKIVTLRNGERHIYSTDY